MSRIRSVHPGLFTDEAFAARSPLAMVLFIGLWTECDDSGIFEWKPITLKMRLLPVHNVDCGLLLEELAEHDMVRRYEAGGRQLGAVRNFCRFQRPKFPKSLHVMTDDIRSYVGSTPPPTVETPVDDPPIPRNAEKSPQMKDGDGEEREKEERKKEPSTSVKPAAREGPLAFAGTIIRLSSADLEAWRKAFPAYPSLESELTAIDAKLRDSPPVNGKWFGQVAGWLRKGHERLQAEAAARPRKKRDAAEADRTTWDEIARQRAGTA